MNPAPSADSDAPDFDRLARETPWSRVQWVLAWKTLDERCDWGVLRDFAKANRMSPDSAARMLNEALAVPDPWDTRPTTPAVVCSQCGRPDPGPWCDTCGWQT